MTRDEQLIKAALDMAAMAAVTTPESRPGAPREWSDGFTSGCLHSADAIRTIDPDDVLAGLPPAPDAVARLVEAARAALNYLENTEGEFGITLGSATVLRAALAAMETDHAS